MATLLLLFSWLVACSAHFKDDMQVIETECLVEGSFSCMSGVCIPPEKYCDGKNDCEDGSDENFCTNHRPDAHFCNETHQFLCADGLRCLPSSWICNDKSDCQDGSDEVDCARAFLHNNSTCKGFECDGGKLCISDLWMCDGYYDCEDKTDEDIKDTCHYAIRPKHLHDTLNCEMRSMNYTCLDKSYCVPFSKMCDGLKDCRDGSDEGTFCKEWNKMCSNHTCPTDSFCKPTRIGPTCVCNTYKQYNPTSGQCERSQQCLQEVPVCSHMCEDMGDYFKCTCDAGYRSDHAEYLCFAPEPEALLFFSTRNDIQYVKVKSKHRVTVVTGIKRAHGVTYDGKYLYWVETAGGHQAIMKAELDDVVGSKQVLAALGLQDPGDVALDYLGDNIYFSDTARGFITVCRSDGALCVTLTAHTHRPKFVTLEPRQGNMYWADWHDKPVIMKAKMDGSLSEILVDKLNSFATGLALDAPNGRLYFVDRTIKVVILNDKRVYSFFEEQFHHPYSLSVFENTVFWSDWTSNTIQTADKIHGTTINRNILLDLDLPVFDMHLYHPILMNSTNNPCSSTSCPLCLITSGTSSVCACPDSMKIVMGHCEWIPGYRPQYLVVAAGSAFTRIFYDTVGNPETHSTHLDVGRVQAMAYDNNKDTLYMYDSQHKSINFIIMSDFSLGVTHLFMYKGLENVVDMDYDDVSDSLYILDAGRRVIEVTSLKNQQTTLLYRFREQEIPISLCVLSAYGRMLVAVLEIEDNNVIHIDSLGLDGDDRKHIVVDNIKGPNIRMRYSSDMDVVYISDDENGVIDFLHPQGTGRENFREVLTTVASLAVTDNHVFWTDRRSTKLYWADIYDATRKIRRIELSIFPNNTHLVILATSPPPKAHGHLCSKPNPPCSHICVQKSHEYIQPGSIDSASTEYTCLCPVGMVNKNGVCSEVMRCKDHEVYCHRSNECFDGSKKCDGVADCKFAEDEESCPISATQLLSICPSDETDCDGTCIPKTAVCRNNTTTPSLTCNSGEFGCSDRSLCIERSLACDGRADCSDGSDEHPDACDTRECLDTEYMCASGSCIPSTWKCDKYEDCGDGSDEIDCGYRTCPSGTFECDTGCVEVYRRCDGKYDCEDHEDERDCGVAEFGFLDAAACAPWEYSCEHNKSICLPLTARCNGRTDCPGGSDEAGCDFHCGELFPCTQEHWCVFPTQLCDGRADCSDGSDESFDACTRANKTRPLTQTTQTPCEGYRCDDGQCLQWQHVCDNKTDCQDGSDENGLCNSSCVAGCITRRTPRGPQCSCSSVCESCSHTCRSNSETTVCACYRGYGLRLDRRSCKAIHGTLSTLYLRGGAAWSLTSHRHSMVYHEGDELSDLDCDVRRNKLYFSSSQSGKLIEVNNGRQPPVEIITNIGRPGKLTVDWITGNIYFVDNTPAYGFIRVCNFDKKMCAKLQKIPSDVEVTSLIVDPANHLLFYCLSESSESQVRSSSLAGRNPSDIASVPGCLGLTVDSFSKILYISTPSGIMKVGYDGSNLVTLIDHPISTSHLAFFEDYIYFIHNSHITRCLHFGTKNCETLNHVYNTSNFVLSHESIQRDDVTNACDKMACEQMCVLERVAVCVCHDGSIVKDGCPDVGTDKLALFTGGTQSHALSLTLLWLVLVLLVIYACAFVLKRNKKTPGEYIQVRYHNSAEGTTQLPNPIIDIPEAGAMSHEFVNPLQFVRSFWPESLERKKIVGLNRVSEEKEDPSDTESDLDVRETRRMIK